MYSFRAMNSNMKAYFMKDSICHTVERWFAYSERKLSRFITESELSQLNHKAGSPFLASDFLYAAIEEAYRYYLETDGLFNPFLHDVLCSLGYDRSFEKLPERTAVRKPFMDSSFPLSLNSGMKSISLSPGRPMDLGGIAKGWTAQQVSQQLKRKGVKTGAISAGGDLVLWSQSPKCWKVGIANPFDITKDLFTLKIHRNAGIATSSTVKRTWSDIRGTKHHHIIDPRTLTSSKSDLIGVTVLAPDLAMAEVYAKCLLIMGWQEGSQWLAAKRPELAAAGIKKDLSIVAAGAMNLYCPEGVA